MFLEADIYLFWSNRNNITSSHFVLSNCYITVIYLIYFRCICYSNIYFLFVYSRDVNNTFTNLIIFWIISMSYYDWAWNIVKFFYTNILLLIFYIHSWKYKFANIYIYYMCNRDYYISLSIFITSIIIDTITRNKEKIDIKTFISFFVFIFQLFFDENLNFIFINSYSLFYIILNVYYYF